MCLEKYLARNLDHTIFTIHIVNNEVNPIVEIKGNYHGKEKATISRGTYNQVFSQWEGKSS